jgi:bis(5'-nucleosidyl)-tetraphosphatase
MIDETWYQRPPDLPERVASGGIIARCEAHKPVIALVREKDKLEYVLPKGGVEDGETLEEAARRQIAEEAGLTQLSLVGKLGMRERLTFNKHRWAQVHYFLFTTEQANGTPTDILHADSPQWFPLDNLPPFFWPEQRTLVETYERLIVRALREQ